MFERRKEIRNVDTIQANQLLQASTGSSTSKLSRRAQALDHLRLRREEAQAGSTRIAKISPKPPKAHQPPMTTGRQSAGGKPGPHPSVAQVPTDNPPVKQRTRTG